MHEMGNLQGHLEENEAIWAQPSSNMTGDLIRLVKAFFNLFFFPYFGEVLKVLC